MMQRDMGALTVPGTLDALPLVRAHVVAAARIAGLDARATHRLVRAVDEIATNIVTHGYAAARRSGVMDVRASVGQQSLTICMEDTGAAYTPNLQPPDDLDLPPEERRIGGLGLFLAVRSVDHFQYERVGARNRHIVTIDLPAAGCARHDS
jgi:anti-sigma regulatory factor (Ser/Thr protein kinase)